MNDLVAKDEMWEIGQLLARHWVRYNPESEWVYIKYNAHAVGSVFDRIHPGKRIVVHIYLEDDDE